MITRKVKKKFEAISVGTPPVADVNAWVQFARRAYDEGYAVGKEAKLEEQQCEKMGRDAWRQCLPLLSDRQKVPAFVACIAHGLQLRILNAEEARVLMYAAQMALASLAKVVQ